MTDRAIDILTRLWRGSPAANAPGDVAGWELDALEREGWVEWGPTGDGRCVPDVTWQAVCELRRRRISQ